MTQLSNLEIQYSPGMRRLSVLLIIFLFGFGGIGWQAFKLEGARFGLYAMLACLITGLYWLVVLGTAPQLVRFADGQLTVRRWLGVRTLRYAEIQAVQSGYGLIILRTRKGSIVLHKLHAQDDARILVALEHFVPAAQQAREERLSIGLPFVFRGRLGTATFTGLSGLMLMGVGIGALGYSLSGASRNDVSLRCFLPVFGLISTGLGALFIYLLLWTYPRRTIFTTQHMTQLFLLHTTVQPMVGVTAFEPGNTLRTVRGVPRRVHHITFRYNNGEEFRWAPGEFDFPVDYVDAAVVAQVNDLVEQLRRAYLTSAVVDDHQAE